MSSYKTTSLGYTYPHSYKVRQETMIAPFSSIQTITAALKSDIKFYACTNPVKLQSQLRLPATPARASSLASLWVLTLLHVNLPVMLFSVIISLEAICSCATAPFVPAIQ